MMTMTMKMPKFLINLIKSQCSNVQKKEIWDLNNWDLFRN